MKTTTCVTFTVQVATPRRRATLSVWISGVMIALATLLLATSVLALVVL